MFNCAVSYFCKFIFLSKSMANEVSSSRRIEIQRGRVLNAAVHWKGASQRMRPIAAECSSSAANGAVGARMRPL